MLKLFRKIDPELITLLNFILLLFIGLLFFNLDRSLVQISLGLATALVFEILFNRLFNKGSPLSKNQLIQALTMGMGFLIFTYSKSIWHYPAGSFVGIASKYFFRFNKEKQIYNPIGFAIVFALAFFPDFKPLMYNVSPLFVATSICFPVFLLGILTTLLTGRWVLSLSYYLFMILGAGLFHYWGKQDFINMMGPEFNVLAMLLVFFIMADPRSSSPKWTSQMAWGITLALANLIFKNEFVYYSSYIAYFLTASLAPSMSALISRSGLQLFLKGKRAS